MKKFKWIIIAMLMLILPFYEVGASTAKIDVSSNKNRVIVGETVKVTVEVESSELISAWSFDVEYSNNLTFISSSSGGLHVVDTNNNGTKYKSYTFTFKAVSSGTAKVSIRNSLLGSLETGLGVDTTNGSVSFQTITQSELEASYSKNNFLSSLEVEGYELTPSFDKRTDSYSLEVPNGTESVNIIATKEDYTASVRGTGEKEVSEGANELNIVVTAQNGSTRTYTITVNVKELDPINVKVDGKDYTVVRKEEFLPKASLFFGRKNIKIGEEEVPGYYAETIKTTLVALKDESGKVELYVYDNNNYKKYNELNFGSLFFVPTAATNIPAGYSETTIEFVGVTYKAYKSDDYDFPLLYGTNVATGNTDFYKYDEKDNTIQRYEGVVIDKSTEELYFYVIIGLFSFTVLSYIIFITLLCRRNKKNKEVLEKTITNLHIQPDELEEPKKNKKEKVKKEKKKKEKNKPDDDSFSEDEIAKL